MIRLNRPAKGNPGIPVLLLTLMCGCAAPSANPPSVHHVVLCWLKEPGNAAQREKIITASRSFREIPGLVEIHAGQPVPSERASVDDTFDIAITMLFASREDMDAYLAHPMHREALKNILLPLTEKVIIYDFEERMPGDTGSNANK